MGSWGRATWSNDVDSGVPRRDRRSGDYWRYVPDRLAGASVVLDNATDVLIADAERRVRALSEAGRDLAGIARFLLRSEAIASSRIEGIAPSARQVALAELGTSEDVKGISEQAQLVANNTTVVREATTRLVNVERVAPTDIEQLHRSLLPLDPMHHGFRVVQNWIGGSDYHPLAADFVPPAPEAVPAAMDDLIAYLNGGLHSPLVQAALVHAQFETVHPFTDGNGRVGRALIHTVLARRGLTPEAVLPISLVLSTLQQTYIDGLTAYRYDALTTSTQGSAARAGWIRTFAEATMQACEQAIRLAEELGELRQEWEERLSVNRAAKGVTRAPRSDSATMAILRDLPSTPVLTVQTVQRIHKVSHVAAGRALEELREAGVLDSKSIGPGRQAYVSNDVLDLVTWAERRLASTKFDTRASSPHAGTPAPPR